MKKLFYIIIFAAFGLLLSSCEKDSGTELTDQKLKVIKSNVTFTPMGGTGTIEVESDGAITAIVDQEWLAVNTSGSTITVIAEPNDSVFARNGIVTIKSGEEKTIVPVTQSGAVFWLDGIDYIKKRVELPTSGGSITGIFKVNSNYKLEKPDWITFTVDESNNYTISAPASPNGQDRSGELIFTVGNRKIVYTVIQTS